MVYAIASIKRSGKLVGIRLLDDLTGITSDRSIEQILKSNLCRVRNLRAVDGKIEWTQGVIDRYPSLDFDTQEKTNTNSLIVLAYTDEESGDKKYTVANFLGQIAELGEKSLVEYGTNYTLANSKVVTKGNNSYIASISGEIEKVSSEAELHYDINTGVVTCNLPRTKINKLEIPSRIRGNKVMYPNEIVIHPINREKDIEHLKFSDGIEMINFGLLSNLTRLRTIDIDTRLEYIYGKLTNPYIEHIRIKEYVYGKITGANIADLSNLKTVIVEKGLTILEKDAFRNCINLDIRSVLKEGVVKVHDGAFGGCGMENLTIPSSVRQIESSTFNGCKRLRQVDIRSNMISINKNIYRSNEAKLFQNCNKIELTAEYGTEFNGLLADNVNLTYREATENDTRVDKLIAKSNMLNVGINAYNVAKTEDEILGAISSYRQNEWEDIVKRVLLNIYKGDLGVMVEGIRGIMIPINPNYRVYSKPKNIQTSKDMALVWYSNHLLVIYTNKELNEKVLSQEGVSRQYGFNRNYKISLTLPSSSIRNSSTNPIKNIEVLGINKVRIHRKYKNIVEEYEARLR